MANRDHAREWECSKLDVPTYGERSDDYSLYLIFCAVMIYSHNTKQATSKCWRCEAPLSFSSSTA